MALCRYQKIGRDHPGTLVNQLVKSVLAIGTGFSPYNRPCGVIHFISVTVNAFAVALHVALLKIGGKAVHILIVGKYDFAFRLKKIGVPDTDQSKDDRNVFFQGSSSEMCVHVVRTGKQRFEIAKAHCTAYGKADGRPEGVSASDPVPELKHVFSVNAERFHGMVVSGYSRKMVLNT